MASGCLAKVVCSDVKHNFLLHYLAAAALAAATPLIFGLSELNEKMAAQPLEIMSILIGIAVLTPVFMPEENSSIFELVTSKKTSHTFICLLRIIFAVIIIALLSGVIAVMLKLNNSDVTLKLYISSLSGAFAIGSLGLLMSSVSRNTIIGYMVTLMYFFMNLILRTKLGYFDLFTFSDGGEKVKILLFLISAVIAASALGIQKFFRK